MKILMIIILVQLMHGCDQFEEVTHEDPNDPNVPQPTISNNTYYVAPDGKDSNQGTIGQPWGSWQKAFNMAAAGDTIYIRGGIYMPDNADEYGVVAFRRSGTHARPICIFNYPGEVPVLDCATITRPADVVGIFLNRCRYIHLKGLTVRGVKQANQDVNSTGISVENSMGIRFENCVSHSNSGSGYLAYETDSIYFINCDAYDNFDVLTAGYSGGQADGFVVCYGLRNSYSHFSGCRSWYNSDDGFDTWENEGVVEFDRCWSFNNGRGDGDGCGFKLGQTSEPPQDVPQRILTNCMAFKNKFIGFNQNDGNIGMTLHNNFAYDNDDLGYELSQFRNQITARNNISFRNGSEASVSNYVTHDHNTWDSSPPVTLTDSDFVNTDASGASGPRQTDGSLPDINFLKLTAGSDLINAGIDVGLPFKGSAPDMGPFERE